MAITFEYIGHNFTQIGNPNYGTNIIGTLSLNIFSINYESITDVSLVSDFHFESGVELISPANGFISDMGFRYVDGILSGGFYMVDSITFNTIAINAPPYNFNNTFDGIYATHTGQGLLLTNSTIGNPVLGTWTQVSCFLIGTNITGVCGEIAVEMLRQGDWIASAFGGSVQIQWVGFRRINCRRHPTPREVWPVLVRAGAFDNDMPRRDLWLSPDHSVLVDDVLIPIKTLVNGTTIVQEQMDWVTYYHVELPSHDVIFAEGLPAESYLDVGNRDAFENGGQVTQIHPNFAQEIWCAHACAPQITHGPIHRRVMDRLLLRADQLATPMTPSNWRMRVIVAL